MRCRRRLCVAGQADGQRQMPAVTARYVTSDLPKSGKQEIPWVAILTHDVRANPTTL